MEVYQTSPEPESWALPPLIELLDEPQKWAPWHRHRLSHLEESLCVARSVLAVTPQIFEVLAKVRHKCVASRENAQCRPGDLPRSSKSQVATRVEVYLTAMESLRRRLRAHSFVGNARYLWNFSIPQTVQHEVEAEFHIFCACEGWSVWSVLWGQSESSLFSRNLSPGRKAVLIPMLMASSWCWMWMHHPHISCSLWSGQSKLSIELLEASPSCLVLVFTVLLFFSLFHMFESRSGCMDQCAPLRWRPS